ncbi:HAD family hydrolase [Nonomuraea sp. SYSU D8015]|uniref:HAD family hydrolase n=1 Tax=Nonomuraea sp. SYSU D8015 TaxID=2593644 RepID=UPI00166124D5|nr:HAD family hydrolase [Nonomuraea sp. SYSU D8015]
MSRITHILFDFFGTLVEYSPSRTEQGYESSHALLRRLGATLSYEEFLDGWSRVCAEFDGSSAQDDHEFSMTEVGAAFLGRVMPREPSAAEVAEFVSLYVSEWNAGVRYLPGLADLVGELSAHYRLAVVTNTHQPTLVPDHLEAMGLRAAFDAVITSVEVGWRKPHPKIYDSALGALGIQASAAVFVGDTEGPDFTGPERAGMTAFLIDPQRLAAIPEDRRLTSVFDLPGRLGPPSA